MIIVTIIALDSDDFETKTEVVPCDTMETARMVVDQALKDYMDDLAEDDGFDEEEWKGDHVRTLGKNGSIYISGNYAGHGKILISEREEVTSDTVGKLTHFGGLLGTIY